MSAPKSKRPVSVVERRLASGNIFATGGMEIPLTDPDHVTIRVVNSQISETHLHDMQAHKGWTYVERADLAVEPTDVGFREQDGRIVSGERGHLVLMKQARADAKKIAAMKDRTNRTHTFGKAAIKRDIVAGASAQLGDEAASFLDRQDITVKDSLERVSLEP